MDEVTVGKKIEIIVAAVLGVLQAVALFVAVAGRYYDWLSVHESAITAAASACVGFIQTFMTSAKPSKIAAPVAK